MPIAGAWVRVYLRAWLMLGVLVVAALGFVRIVFDSLVWLGGCAGSTGLSSLRFRRTAGRNNAIVVRLTDGQTSLVTSWHWLNLLVNQWWLQLERRLFRLVGFVVDSWCNRDGRFPVCDCLQQQKPLSAGRVVVPSNGCVWIDSRCCVWACRFPPLSIILARWPNKNVI